MAAEQSDAGLITMEQASRLLMIGEERVRQLIKSGHIARGPRGKVLLVSAVQGYIRFLKDEGRSSSKSASQSRVSDARAREIELRIAREENRLVDIEEHDAVFDEAFGALKAGLSSVPSRVTKDIALRRKIETELDDVLRACCSSFEQATADLKATGEAAAPVAEDDA